MESIIGLAMSLMLIIPHRRYLTIKARLATSYSIIQPQAEVETLDHFEGLVHAEIKEAKDGWPQVSPFSECA